MESKPSPAKKKRALRFLIIGLLVAFALTALMYGAVKLDESERPTRIMEQSGRKDFFVVEVREEPGPTLVLECDEGVHGDANTRFREFLKVEGPPVSIPGGAFLLAKLPSELSTEHGAVARAAIELIKRHSPERIILIAHSECLLYDVGGAYLNHPEMVKLAQVVDINKVATLIRDWLPKTKVEAYYALKEGGQVRFNPIPLQEAGEVR